ENFTNTTLENTLAEINTKLNTTAIAPIVLIFIILTCIALLLSLGYAGMALSEISTRPQPGDETLIRAFQIQAWVCGITFAVVMLCGVFLTKALRKRDKLRRTAQLFYELDTDAQARYDKVLQAFEALAQSSMVWSQQTRQATNDWKRNAGARTLITRR